MGKRDRLEIIKDILQLIRDNEPIRPTPLLRKSNLSSKRFSEYYKELIEKSFVKEISGKKGKHIILTDKGLKYLKKYENIVEFIEEFEL